MIKLFITSLLEHLRSLNGHRGLCLAAADIHMEKASKRHSGAALLFLRSSNRDVLGIFLGGGDVQFFHFSCLHPTSVNLAKAGKTSEAKLYYKYAI